jgi:hypothetical protein
VRGTAFIIIIIIIIIITETEQNISFPEDSQGVPTRPSGKDRLVKKVKAVQLQAWSGPEGSRKLKFPDFMTTAQDVGKVVSLTHRPPLAPGNTPGTHFC